MHQSTTPSLSQTIWPSWASRQFFSLPIVLTLLPVTFGYSLSSEAVIMRQLRRWKRLWRRSLTRSHKWTSMGPGRSCWNGTTSALQPEETTSKRDKSFMCVLSIKVSIRKSGNLFNDSRIYIYIYIYIYIRVCVCLWLVLTYFNPFRTIQCHEFENSIHLPLFCLSSCSLRIFFIQLYGIKYTYIIQIICQQFCGIYFQTPFQQLDGTHVEYHR